MKRKLPYAEGTWFAVPLRQAGFAVGLVARAKRGIVLGYFFGPGRPSAPTLSEVENLKPEDAVKVIRVGDSGLLSGSWLIIGHSACWNTCDWRMRDFIRREPLSGRAFRVHYSDTDPSHVEWEKAEPTLNISLTQDCLYGAGAAEIVLTELLN